MNKELKSIGGQAVVEGVMMKDKTKTCMAVRDEQNNIQYTQTENAEPKNKFYSLPFVRGFVNFYFLLKEGMGYINKSANMAFKDNKDDKKDETTAFMSKFIPIISVSMGILISVILFIFLPTFFASFFTKLINNNFIINIIEGGFRIIIFVIYLLVMRIFKDMKRFFMYHGAEHKTISCYESGLDLTVENIKKCSRFHPRCGTTFMFLLMIISIFLYSFLIWTNSIFLRTFLRLLLLPVIAGVSYEILKFLAKSKNKCFWIFKAPGLALQKITTAEPTDDMIEVALCAFNGVLLSKEEMDNWRSSNSELNIIDYD